MRMKQVWIPATVVVVAGLLFFVVWRSRPSEPGSPEQKSTSNASWKQAEARPAAGGAAQMRFPDARAVLP